MKEENTQSCVLHPSPVQLVVVVRVAGLDVLLPAVEDWLGGQQLSKDAANGPDV